MYFLGIYLFVVTWWLVGMCGYQFWFTKEFGNMDLSTSFLRIGTGLFGPLSWLVGYLIHGSK